MRLDRLAPWWRHHPLAGDRALAVSLGALGTFSVINQYWVNADVGVPLHQSRGVSIMLVWLCIASLAIRRIAPATSFTVCVAAFIATRVWEAPEATITVVALAVSFISVGVNGRPIVRHWARVSAAVGLIVMYFGVAARMSRRSDLGDAFNNILAFDVLFSSLLIAGAWLLGDAWRQRGEHARDLAARTVELDDERRRNAERAVIEERLRIARELHDVLAHHVSVMGVQAAAAGRVLDRDPDRARASLAQIESSSREAIDEFRGLVGFLRAGADIDIIGPHPGLDRCGELVADAQRAGLDVELRVHGPRTPLPPGVDLSAFRVVQEALTNTRKHAHATRACVEISYHPHRLDITVTDDGHGVPAGTQSDAPQSSPRLGLLGMRERLRLHEGRLETGRDGNGGFRVHAEFPVRSQS